ncbi:RNA-binding protein [Vibrio phage VB_VaC_TDDLMA]
MSKFNKSKVDRSTPDSTNLAGGVSYDRKSIKADIASVVLTSMLNGDSFYETEQARLKRIESLASNQDVGEFVAKAMVYARTQGNLRSVSHFLANILSENVKGETFVRSALTKTFVRPDDLTEVLALWNERNPGKSVPNSLRRAFKDSLETFDNYQLKKYAGERQSVKLRDVVKLAHPTPAENRDFKGLIEGTLTNIETAQTVNAGSTGKERADTYKSMLSNRKLGLMAAMKNIKNIVEAGADDETIDMLCSLFENQRAIEKSRVLPYRFVQAFVVVDEMNMDRLKAKRIIKSLERGFMSSAKNLPFVKDGERVALLLDESCSMGSSRKDSSLLENTPFNHGKTMFASVLSGLNTDNTVGYLWAQNSREFTLNDSPFEFLKNTRSQGGGTDVWAPIKSLIDSKTVVDKLVIFTDMQMYEINRGWGSTTNREFKDMVKDYRKINPNVKVLFWNLTGYGGGTPMKLDHNILEVSGFSDKILEVAGKMLEYSDKDFLVKEIESVQL